VKRSLIAVAIPVQQIADLVTACTDMIVDERHPVERPFPDDTRYVRAQYDADTDQFILVYEHETFPGVPEGAMVMRVGITSLREYIEELERKIDEIEGIGAAGYDE
jgi:hypothetical protein